MTALSPLVRTAGRAGLALLGEHPSIRAVRDVIARAAAIDAPVVVEGETGTGKEIVASLLHAMSCRAGPLSSVNMAAVPESLAETELFGVARGAYTGATHDKPGRIEEADRGTLYLDECADMSMPVQGKLLRVVETGIVRRVGDVRDRASRFRLVLSTQVPCASLVATGRWREDFMFRVVGVTILLPRLIDRGSDVRVLANYFLALEGCPPLAGGAERVLLTHAWPGNVRELRSAVGRAIFLAAGEVPDAEGIVAAAKLIQGNAAPRACSAETLRAVVSSHIRHVVDACGGNIADAARILGLSRSQLYRRLEQFSEGRRA